MLILKSILLGIVQGLTEFLPVSSTGHLVLIEQFFPMVEGNNLLYEILLHLACLCAVFIYFRKDIARMAAETIGMLRDVWWNLKINLHNRVHEQDMQDYRKVLHNNYRMLSAQILTAMVPTAVIGWMAKDFLNVHAHSMLVNGLGFLITAVILLVVDNWNPGNRIPRNMKLWQGVLIGVCQGIAIIPGCSRMGIVIAAALLLGFNRKVAVKYACLLSIPSVLGAFVMEIGAIGQVEMTVLTGFSYVFGMLAAGVVSYLVIRWMVRFVRQHHFRMFAVYSAVFGILSLILYQM